MEDIACPRCKTTKYRNPSLKLLVNVCGHALCENCVELLFVKGSGACIECETPLRRSNFRLQIFEDATVEKEVDIRRKVLKDFNKREDDFDTLSEYNDYLEEIESIIYNLANNIDLEGTKRKIETYKKENKAQIQKNKGKLSKEEETLEELLYLELENVEYRKQCLADEQEEEILKKQQKENLINELMSNSDLPAELIVKSHLAKQRDPLKLPPQRPKVKQFSSGIKVGGHQDVFLPVPKAVEGTPYTYEPPNFDFCGPSAPSFENLDEDQYTNHVRSANDSEKAAGFISNFACYRALQDAFCGLHFTPT